MAGNPLEDLPVPLLEPAEEDALAHECMVKTRRRKGLVENVSITTYLEDSALVELARATSAVKI